MATRAMMTASTPRPASRIEQAKIVRVVGQRMREARELNNMSQVMAARRLGYSNPSKLSKIESASDTNSVPLWVIARAAKLYEVSIDFLMGASSDWESGARMTQEREVSGWMLEAWERYRQRDMEVLRVFHNKIEAIEELITVMSSAALEASNGLERFSELNPAFEDMRGGSRLVSGVSKVKEAAELARAKMKRFRKECSIAATETNQLTLFVAKSNGG